MTYKRQIITKSQSKIGTIATFTSPSARAVGYKQFNVIVQEELFPEERGASSGNIKNSSKIGC